MANTLEIRKTGTCKWFNFDKGYGFISPDDGSSDVYVHCSAIHSQDYWKFLVEGKHRKVG